MPHTLDYYNRNSRRMAEQYESVDFSGALEAVFAALPSGARVLELGCGSGRDAAALVSRGFEVTAMDGSAEMLREAVRRHPELAGGTVEHVLPGELPFETASFDAVLSMAVIMHLHESELPTLFHTVHRVLRPGGLFAYSVNTERAGRDEHGTDERGRHFTCLSASQWERYHTNAGFITEWCRESDDVTGRPGVRWVTLVCRRGAYGESA